MKNRLWCLLAVLLIDLSVALAEDPCVDPSVTGPTPLNPSFCPSTPLHLTVVATGTGPFSYQWRRNGDALTDDWQYSCTNTATLMIKLPMPANANDTFDCAVTNACNTATSQTVSLTQVSLSGDSNQDCVIDSSDVQSFASCRAQSGAGVPCPDGCAQQDLDGDSDVDMDDFGILQRSLGTDVRPPQPIVRDIAFVVDLSLSMSFESCLMTYRNVEIGNRGVWAYLWDTSLAPQPTLDGLPLGPSFGNMNTWGTDTVDASWNYSVDPGLRQLKRGTNWGLTSAWVSQSLAAYRATQNVTFQTQHPAAYTSLEMAVINSATGAGTETSTSNSTQLAAYRRRVRVALGIDRWESGKSGGQVGKSNNGTGAVIGNGDNVIDASEAISVVPYPNSASNPATFSKQVGGSWDSMIDYVADTAKSDNITSNTGLTYRFLQYNPDQWCYGNPDLRWRFGLKTWIDYVQNQQYTSTQSPGLAGSPQEPWATGMNGIDTIVSTLQYGPCLYDQVGLSGFGQIGYGPLDYPTIMSWLSRDFGSVATKVNLYHPGMFTGNTCTSQGIDKAAGTGAVAAQNGVLSSTSHDARSLARKIIILITDGGANVKRSGTVDSSPFTIAEGDAISAATEAHAKGVQLFVIGVGQSALRPDVLTFLQNLAQAGGGTLTLASRDPAVYQQQLLDLIAQFPH